MIDIGQALNAAIDDFFSDEHIWTQTEANDVIYYETGRTGINAVGYIVCVIPWTTEISFAVEYRTEDGEPPQWMKDQDADVEERS